jgi:hypothetical protein
MVIGLIGTAGDVDLGTVGVLKVGGIFVHKGEIGDL